MSAAKSKGWINWRSSAARAILLRDLEPGGPLVGMDHVPARDIYEYYKDKPGFEQVVFDQFKDRLADHRKQASRDREYAERDAEACRVDRLVHPRDMKNPRGEPVFDLHPAKRFLRMDVANGLHNTLSPMELQKTRPAYGEFKLRVFKHRIYQEIRRTKFLYWLELQRNKDIPQQQSNQRPNNTGSRCEAIATEQVAQAIPSMSIKGRKRKD